MHTGSSFVFNLSVAEKKKVLIYVRSYMNEKYDYERYLRNVDIAIASIIIIFINIATDVTIKFQSSLLPSST